MTDLTHVAHNIRLAREEMGLTREELARYADLPEGVVAAAERGHWGGVSELHSIALTLHVELSELLSPDPPRFGPKPLWCQDTESMGMMEQPWELLPPGTRARLRELETQRDCVSVSERLCTVMPTMRELVSALRHSMGDWCPACIADVSEGEDDHFENCPLLAVESLIEEGG